MMKMLREFRQFAVRGNVVDMAVGFTVGAAFTTIVRSLVNDLIMPPIGLLLGDVDFSAMAIRLRGPVTGPEGKVIKEAIELRYGLFLNNLLTFVIVALAIFLLIKAIKRFQAPPAPLPPPPPPRQEQLLEEIRDLLKRQ